MWHVKPRKHKDGYFRLCAESDEGGGFHEGCDHQHIDQEAAAGCLEAQVKLGACTGFPHGDIDDAASAYEAYRLQAGGVSLATGDPLPHFRDLSWAIQAAWCAAARAVKMNTLSDVSTAIERQFGYLGYPKCSV